MLCKLNSLGFQGIAGYVVTAECYLSGGLPRFDLVGLPDTAVKESKERVHAAIKTCGFQFPVSHITVNLAPADRKKVGTLYDLPILVGILVAGRQLRLPDEPAAFVGELSLSGDLRPVRGMLPMALAAAEAGIKTLYVPAESAAEATLAEGVTVYPIAHVSQLVEHLRGIAPMTPAPKWVPVDAPMDIPDFSDVKGQDAVKRAMEIAAAGGHHLLMAGPPGSGKSMLAKRLPGILPDMTMDEALETTAIHSIMGMIHEEEPLLRHRVFRSPHHSVSMVGMAGGGTNPRPGEISLAHNGVLFLDELPEFHKDVLEALRQPLEDGKVQITRAAGTEVFPSQFMMVCAMNPCPCGWFGSDRPCKCSQRQVDQYLSRLSGPLLDRVDLYVTVPALPFQDLSRKTPSESSADVKKRVEAARHLQRQRYGREGASCNAQMSPKELQTHCDLDESCTMLLEQAHKTLGLTGRSYDRILRVARTIADLDNAEQIDLVHLTEALQYRITTQLGAK